MFSDTNDPEYLKSLKEFYYSVILNHKKVDLGYVYGIDAYLETATTSQLNQRASGMIANKIHLTFVPTDDVKIIWTKIGNHEITEPFITTFMNHPIVVEELVTRKILWGLLGTKTEPVFVEIEGYLLVPEIRQALTAIVGFYFGQATVKR